MVALTGLASVAWPSQAEAQRFGFGVGFRGGVRHSSTVVFVGRYGFLPYDPWYSFGYGYPAPYYAPYYYDPYRYEASSLRIQVKPKQAEVFVDGYRAGVVDDFDGVFQRLYLPPGHHDITIYLPGYRTWTENMFLQPGGNPKIELNLEPLPPGATSGPRPIPHDTYDDRQGPPMQTMAPRRIPGGGALNQPQMPPPPDSSSSSSSSSNSVTTAPTPAPVAPSNPANAGSLSIRVEPGTADLYVDGQKWRSLGDGDQLILQLSEGKHQIEVRKPGYQRYNTEVDIKRGDTTTLSVTLKR